VSLQGRRQFDVVALAGRRRPAVAERGVIAEGSVSRQRGRHCASRTVRAVGQSFAGSCERRDGVGREPDRGRFDVVAPWPLRRQPVVEADDGAGFEFVAVVEDCVRWRFAGDE